MSVVKIKRALISVSNKNGLLELAQILHKNKVEILSTGGTLKTLQENGVAATAVEKWTGFPEMMDGRVKTLHPKIHGGLLYRRGEKSHVQDAEKHGISPIDLVVVNLYPFEEVTQKPNVDFETAIENIDIGGPSMLRSAAKNFESVAVVCDPSDYATLQDELQKNEGSTSLEFRRFLSGKVFARTAAYDKAIANFFASRSERKSEGATGILPATISLEFSKEADLRYGENPHQPAALYHPAKGANLQFEQLNGKEISFNNLLDMDGALDIVSEFSKPAVCVVKHNNPCGIAEADHLEEAAVKAIHGDPLSAFGGIVGLNRPCDGKVAQAILKELGFFEVITAPSFSPEALELLKARKNLRILAVKDAGLKSALDYRFLKAGLLVQLKDPAIAQNEQELRKKLNCVTAKKVSEADIDELLFAWKCVKTVKSNAIVLTKDRQTIGIGAGQMSRVDSVEIACKKAGNKTQGAFLGSDAFFPMPDSIEIAAKHGIKAIIQTGGSIKDPDVIAACDELGIAMVLTGERHFRH